MKPKKFFGLSIDPKVLRLSFDPTMQWFSGFTIIVVEMRTRMKGEVNWVDRVRIGVRPGEPICKVISPFGRICGGRFFNFGQKFSDPSALIPIGDPSFQISDFFFFFVPPF
jgi:hypothetical protein